MLRYFKNLLSGFEPCYMSFNLQHIKQILSDCDSGQEGERPFMSAYQIAIEFERRFPEETQGLAVGGAGVGEHRSLAQQIALFLSRVVREKVDPGIERGFISHLHLDEMRFDGNKGEAILVSTLKSERSHSIFRLVESADRS